MMETTRITNQIEALLTSLLVEGTDVPSAEDLVEKLEHPWTESKYDEDFKRQVVDSCLRNILTTSVLSLDQIHHPNLKSCKKLFEIAVNAVQGQLASPTCPILILADTFDLITLDHCQVLFPCVEENLPLFTTKEFFSSIKNSLLRMCNDLLRRLSQTLNTSFCGRIMLFLAKFFPFSDRSGLNVISEFNYENVTAYIESSEEFERNDHVGLNDDATSLNVDYALYRKFWQLQDFFRSPNQCYNKARWKTFTTFASDILKAFQCYKLDPVHGKLNCKKSEINENGYFAKFLTSQSLLQLQLNDSTFRRFVLTQLMILFHYLKSTVKFKSDSDVLTASQKTWIDDTERSVVELITETPPDGQEFATCVKSILAREQQWNIWKNEGCKSLTTKQGNENMQGVKLSRKRKARASLGQEMEQSHKAGKYLIGNQNLTELWNLFPRNIEACRAEERDFLPTLEEYFQEAIEELDPKNQIEDSYKKVFNGSWGWRALRLLARKSPHFFTYGNNPIAKLPDYLEQMLKKMVKESNFKDSVWIDAKAETSAIHNESSISSTQLEALANRISAKWALLAPKLGLGGTAIKEIEEKNSTDEGRALALLTEWKNIEGDDASKDELLYVLEGLKLKDFAVDILC